MNSAALRKVEPLVRCEWARHPARVVPGESRPLAICGELRNVARYTVAGALQLVLCERHRREAEERGWKVEATR